MTKQPKTLRASHARHRQAGFTLLELLVIVAVLIGVATVVSRGLEGTYDNATAQLARAEMREVAEAVRQFREDTGFYPKQGVFDLSSAGGSVDPSGFPGSSAAQRAAWFYSPANLMQLIRQPEASGGTEILPWDPETGRGWRGPYLRYEGLVDVGDNLQTDGSGDPVVVDTLQYVHIPGIGDPFSREPATPDTGTDCEEVAGNTNCVLDWRAVQDDASAPLTNAETALADFGRPYLYFFDTNVTTNVPACTGVPCLLSTGPNGFYDAGDNDDLVVVVQ
ncbi:MAG: prepilin-type N-terminal cleavage/methylation domain-containing protein [Pseudomonadota bacterium]